MENQVFFNYIFVTLVTFDTLYSIYVMLAKAADFLFK